MRPEPLEKCVALCRFVSLSGTHKNHWGAGTSYICVTCFSLEEENNRKGRERERGDTRARARAPSPPRLEPGKRHKRHK